MNRFMHCATLVSASTAFALLAAIPAQAGKLVSVSVQAQAPVQILGADSFCSSWNAGTDAATGTPTLTCVPVTTAGGPVGCTATINGTNTVTLPSTGGTVSLAASCTSPASGITYNWTRNGASGSNAATWSDTLPVNSNSTIANTTSYQVSICVGAACVTAPASPLTAIVPAVAAPAGAPSGCVATINGSTSASLAATGGSVNLSASCSSPSSGITYNWTRNGASASNAASWSESPPENTSTANTSTTNYQVQACKGSSCVNVSPTLTATRAAATTTPTTPTAWNGTCAGFDNTTLIVMDWNRPVRMYTRQAGGFTPKGAIVVQFTTGLVSTTNILPRLTAAEYDSSPSSRIAVLSDKPCDFGKQEAYGAMMESNSIMAVFAIGTGSGMGFYPVLKTNTTYYLNMKNGPSSSCTANNSCDMFIDLVKAAGF